MTVNELRKLFESFGRIENINVLYEKNCVFIDYYEEASAVAAQRCMQGVTIHGNILDLGFGQCDRSVWFLSKLICRTLCQWFN